MLKAFAVAASRARQLYGVSPTLNLQTISQNLKPQPPQLPGLGETPPAAYHRPGRPNRQQVVPLWNLPAEHTGPGGRQRRAEPARP